MGGPHGPPFRPPPAQIQLPPPPQPGARGNIPQIPRPQDGVQEEPQYPEFEEDDDDEDQPSQSELLEELAQQEALEQERQHEASTEAVEQQPAALEPEPPATTTRATASVKSTALASLVAYGSDDEDEDEEDTKQDQGPQERNTKGSPSPAPGPTAPEIFPNAPSYPHSSQPLPASGPIPGPVLVPEKKKSAPIAFTGEAQLRTGTITSLVPSSLLINRKSTTKPKPAVRPATYIYSRVRPKTFFFLSFLACDCPGDAATQPGSRSSSPRANQGPGPEFQGRGL